MAYEYIFLAGVLCQKRQSLTEHKIIRIFQDSFC
jgi:hypothetical protein